MLTKQARQKYTKVTTILGKESRGNEYRGCGLLLSNKGEQSRKERGLIGLKTTSRHKHISSLFSLILSVYILRSIASILNIKTKLDTNAVAYLVHHGW